jgi:hypothetical protein
MTSFIHTHIQSYRQHYWLFYARLDTVTLLFIVFGKNSPMLDILKASRREKKHTSYTGYFILIKLSLFRCWFHVCLTFNEHLYINHMSYQWSLITGVLITLLDMITITVIDHGMSFSVLYDLTHWATQAPIFSRYM